MTELELLQQISINVDMIRITLAIMLGVVFVGVVAGGATWLK